MNSCSATRWRRASRPNGSMPRRRSSSQGLQRLLRGWKSQRSEAAGRAPGVGIAENDPVLAGFLGRVKGAVGTTERVCPAAILWAAAGNSETGREVHRSMWRLDDRPVQLLANPARNLQQRIHREAAGTEHRKFLPAKPRSDVLPAAQLTREHSADFTQHGVADFVTKPVVDLLEVVQVQQNQPESLTGFAQATEQLLAALGEHAP